MINMIKTTMFKNRKFLKIELDNERDKMKEVRGGYFLIPSE